MPPLSFEGSIEDAHDAIVEVLKTVRRMRILVDEPDYVHAELTSALFGFVDDVELAIDRESRRIDFRSASRVGHWDLGANRRRMRTISRRLRERGHIQHSRATDR